MLCNVAALAVERAPSWYMKGMGILLGGMAVALALAWLIFPGFGLIDLSVSWSADWPVMLEAGWGLFTSVGLGLPLLVAAARPRTAPACLMQLGTLTGCLVVASVAGAEPTTWWMLIMAALSLAALEGVRRRHRLALGAVGPWQRPMLILALVAAPAALPYAWHMAAATRLDRPLDVTNDVDHFAVQAALALAVLALPVVAARWPATRRLLGTSAALMAGWCGLVSLGWPGAVGGWSPTLSVAIIAWSLLVLEAAWRTQRAPAAEDVCGEVAPVRDAPSA